MTIPATPASWAGITQQHAALDAALRAYKAAPNPLTLLRLNQSAIPLLNTAEKQTWRPVPDTATEGTTLPCDFAAIRVVCDRRLEWPDIGRLTGCVAYALKATLAGEELGEPSVEFACSPGGNVAFTVVEFAYDASRSIRTEPDPIEAFRIAREYLLNGGTPVRTTNREGPGTQGTRLVEGLSAPCAVTFYVR